MLGTDAYEKSYSDTKYREAKDHTDLFTALAGELEDIEAEYNRRGYAKRQRTFNISDSKEATFHATARPLEYQLDSAVRSVENFLPAPHEKDFVVRTYKRSQKVGWNNTHANKLELKLRNVRRIIIWFKDRYSMELRKRYWFEDSSIYVGGYGHVPLPEDTFTALIAELLFEDPKKIWPMSDFIDAIAVRKGVTLYSTDYEAIDYLLVKRCSQAINDKIEIAKGSKTKLVVCMKSQVKLNTKLFHILDRITTE